VFQCYISCVSIAVTVCDWLQYVKFDLRSHYVCESMSSFVVVIIVRQLIMNVTGLRSIVFIAYITIYTVYWLSQ